MKRTIFLTIGLSMVFLFSGCAIAPTAPEVKTEVRISDVAFYPPPPDEPRLQFLCGFTREEDIFEPEQSGLDKFLFGGQKSGKEILRPWDIGVSEGKIYLLDSEMMKIVYIDLVEKKFEMIRDTGIGQLNNPAGIWVTEDDIKYVADKGRQQVVVFGQENEFLRVYGNKDLFEKPLDVAVYGKSVYVIDMGKNSLFVLDKENGGHVKTIGEPGHGEGQFWKPTHVYVDRSGNIFVNDAFNFRIQKFDPEGNFIKSYGTLGDTPGSLARAKGLCVSEEGHLYVADVAFGNVQIFDEASGQLLLFFGGKGSGPGTMEFPTAVQIDRTNISYFNELADKNFRVEYLLYVGNFFGPRRLMVFGYGQWIGPSISGQ